MSIVKCNCMCCRQVNGNFFYKTMGHLNTINNLEPSLSDQIDGVLDELNKAAVGIIALKKENYELKQKIAAYEKKEDQHDSFDTVNS